MDKTIFPERQQKANTAAYFPRLFLASQKK
jgi:hypothetical protein